MQFYYGDRNLLRILDEVQFWKRQEAEHTVVIRQVVENLEPQYVKLLQEWEQAFIQTEGVATKYMEAVIRANYSVSPVLEQQIVRFINYALTQSQNFILLLNEIETQSGVVRNNPVARVVIDHIRRESEYFSGIIKAFTSVVKTV